MTNYPTISYPRALSVGFVAVAITVLCLASSHAATSSINPVADAFVTPGSDGSLSGNNYGSGGLLALAAPGKSQGEFQSVLKFNLAATKSAFDSQFGAGQWTIQSVTLQLTAAPANNTIFNTPSAGSFSASWMQNDSWTEGTGTPNAPTTDGITFDSLPTFLGAGDENLGTFSFDGSTSGSTSYTLTLTPGFTADLLGGNTVSLRLLAADSNVSYLFNSRTFNTAASRPLLTVTAVPEPGSYILALLGLFLVIRRRRR